MGDLAYLGLAIDSKPAVDASTDMDRMTASAVKAEKAADDLGRGFEQAGRKISGMSKAAERIERDVQQAQRAMGGMSTASQRMVAEYGKIERAAEQMGSAVTQANAGFASASAAAGMAATGLQQVAGGLGKAGAQAGAANQNIKLTAGQVQNLGYQVNDVATMLLMGASPFQILASQGGQVVQALGDGPGGVKGSLAAIGTAIGSLITPVTLAAAAFTALGAGAIYFATRGQAKIMPLTDAMEAHKAAMDAVADSYGVAAGQAEKFQRASAGAVSFAARQSRAQLELSARSSLREAFAGGGGIMDAITGDRIFGGRIGGEGRAAVQVFEQFKAFEDPLLRLLDGLATGTARADKFVDEVAKIANMRPANEELQKAAKRLTDMAGAAADAQRQLNGLAPAFLRAAENAKRFRELGAGLGDFIPDRRSDAQRIDETFDQMMRLAKTEADVTRAQDLRRLSLEGLAEVETRRRDGYGLDVRAITARSAAERAQIEYERTYADVLASTNDKAQAACQAEEARSLTMQEAAYQQAEAMNERIRAGQAQVDQLQLEIETFGRSAGEIARLTTETQLLTAAREAARQVGGIVDPAEEQAIRDQAAAIGELTDRMTRLDLGRDQEEAMRRLQAEAGMIHLNADARRVAIAGLEAEAELRRQGIPLNEAWGQTYVDNARNMAAFEVFLDKQQEAFEGLRDVVSDFFQSLTSGQGILESFVGAFSKFGNDLTSKGLDKLTGGLFGMQGKANATGFISAPAAASQNVSAYSSGAAERTFAAPVAAVERRVLPSLTSFSKELDSAAKAIRTIESGSAAGNYSALGPVTRSGDRAYGAYQVMGNNIADWSRSAIGREVSKMEFLRSVELQDKIFEHRFGGYMQKYGAEGASRAWFAGEGGMKNWKATDVVGTSVGGYGSKFYSLYAQNDNRSAAETQRVIAKGTATGMRDGIKATAYDMGGFDASHGSAGASQGLSRAQAGLQGAFGLFGLAAQGYQSGNPIMGGISGLMGGMELGSSLGGALGLGAAGGPVGMALGAAAGCMGGEIGTKHGRAA